MNTYPKSTYVRTVASVSQSYILNTYFSFYLVYSKIENI